jgi:hypothetical protein
MLCAALYFPPIGHTFSFLSAVHHGFAKLPAQVHSPLAVTFFECKPVQGKDYLAFRTLTPILGIRMTVL